MTLAAIISIAWRHIRKIIGVAITPDGGTVMEKALTIWQPWAQLLAMGTKNNETRSWGTRYRGRILIHAAKVDHQYIVGRYPHELFQYFEAAGAIYKDFPLGAIIGQANLVECIQMDRDYCDWMKKWNPGEYAFGDYAPADMPGL